jgi:glucose-specific phosphotransferase system IIA component
MFGLFQRKVREVHAPVDGEVVALEEVEDEVFSQKMLGDGVAIKPIGRLFCAPIDGKVTKIFPTNHAYSIQNPKDLEVMVHIGLESVALQGEGFTRLVEEGSEVKAGTPIIEVDMEVLKQCKSTITPMVLLEGSSVGSLEKKMGIVKQGDTVMKVGK